MLEHLVAVFLVTIVAMEIYFFSLSRFTFRDISFKQKMLKLQIESLLVMASVFCFIGYLLGGI